MGLRSPKEGYSLHLAQMHFSNPMMNAVVNHLYISYETQKELHSSLLHHRDLGRLRDGATSMVLYDVDGGIRRRWWYTTSVVVYDVDGGIVQLR